MGALSDNNVRDFLIGPGLGVPGPIGAVDGRLNMTATEICREGGDWVYGCEINLLMWPSRHTEVELRDGRAHSVEAMEIKTNDPKLAGRTLVICEFPYSYNWYGWALFRHARKNVQTAKKKLQEEFDHRHDLRDAIAALPFDPFETDRRWWTARIDDMRRLHWNRVARNRAAFHVKRSPNYRYGAKANLPAQWFFGICDDLASIVDELMARRIGHIEEAFKGWRYDPGLTDLAKKLQDPILRASIVQALAGRRYSQPSDGPLKSERVLDRVDEIFRKHVEALAGRQKRTRKGDGPVHEVAVECVPATALANPPDIHIEERAQALLEAAFMGLKSPGLPSSDWQQKIRALQHYLQQRDIPPVIEAFVRHQILPALPPVRREHLERLISR